MPSVDNKSVARAAVTSATGNATRPGASPPVPMDRLEGSSSRPGVSRPPLPEALTPPSVLERAAAQQKASHRGSLIDPIEGVELGKAPADMSPAKNHHMGPYTVSEVHARGNRPTMEDASMVRWYPAESLGIAAVFDGHGGRWTAATAARWAGRIVQAHIRVLSPEQRCQPEVVQAAIENAFASPEADLRVDAKSTPLPTLHGMLYARYQAALRGLGEARVNRTTISAEMRSAAENSGAAVTMAVFLEGHLYIANLGDSRAVLVRKDGTAQRLSYDQKPHVLLGVDGTWSYNDEGLRILQRGGELIPFHGLRVKGPNGNVALARALGDFGYGVGRRPQVTCIEAHAADNLALLLGCDGIFDQMHDDVHATFIHHSVQQGKTFADIGRNLLQANFYRESNDNMTAMLIPLK